MNNFKGTPGPFIIKDILPFRLSIVIGEGIKEQAIASIYGNGTDPEILANCKLLCASKDMAEALQELLRFENALEWGADRLQYPDNFLKAIEAAKAALSKALD